MRTRLLRWVLTAMLAGLAAGPAEAWGTVTFEVTGKALPVHPIRRDFLGLALEYRSVPVNVGVGLEADVPSVDEVEVRELQAGIGRSYIDGLELGNEPELYRVVPWYRTIGGRPAPWYSKRGAPVYARGPGWSAARFLADWGRTLDAIGWLPVPGPSTGSLPLLGDFARAFLSRRSQLRTLTWHAYGLNDCVTDRSDPRYPSVPHLLSSLLGISSPAAGPVRAWAVRLPDGTVNVVLINASVSRGSRVAVGGLAGARGGTLLRLRAASAYATAGVTHGGHGFGTSTATGVLPAPAGTPVNAQGARYAVTLPAASAAVLTAPAH